MKKSLVALIVALFVFTLVVFIIALTFGPAFSGNAVKGTAQPILLTAENFPLYLQGTLAPDLPKNSKVSVSVADKDYSITGNSVKAEQIQDADVSIDLPESYLDKQYNGICDLLRDIAKNGDVGVETSLSNAELLWKYRSLLRYRACFTS